MCCYPHQDRPRLRRTYKKEMRVSSAWMHIQRRDSKSWKLLSLFMRARACEYIKVCRGKNLWLRGDLECKKTASDYAFSSSSRVWKTGTLRKPQVVHGFVSSLFSSSLSTGERIICGNADVAFVERFIRVEPKGAREKLQNFHIRDWNVWDIVFISRIFRPYFSYVQ